MSALRCRPRSGSAVAFQRFRDPPPCCRESRRSIADCCHVATGGLATLRRFHVRLTVRHVLIAITVLVHLRDPPDPSVGKADAACCRVGPVITFEDVWCARGSTPVLRDLSLSIESGETVALVGRSGAGKSTALKLINRMLEPDRGRVLVDGRDTRTWESTALRRRTGYMLQEVGLFPHMTVARNVGVVPHAAPLGARSDRRDARANCSISSASRRRRSPIAGRDQLSGGQRQRVGVARALAADPPVVLMDEPFGALDPVTRGELHDVVRRIQSVVRKTIVLVTHDMREAFALADRDRRAARRSARRLRAAVGTAAERSAGSADAAPGRRPMNVFQFWQSHGAETRASAVAARRPGHRVDARRRSSSGFPSALPPRAVRASAARSPPSPASSRRFRAWRCSGFCCRCRCSAGSARAPRWSR